VGRRTDPSQLQTALRGVRLLEMFVEEQRDLTLAEICSRLAIPKSTGARFLNTFMSAGYLERVGIGVYRLGPSIELLSRPPAIEQHVSQVATPYLQSLVDQFGESTHLGVRRGRAMVTAGFLEGTHTIRMASHVGARRPIHCSSMGKALLAFSDPSVIDLVLYGPLEQLTSNTVTDPDALRRELAAIREQGYAVDNEEVEIGLRCVGAPVFDYSGTAIAGISISGPTLRVASERVDEIGQIVRETAYQLSRSLGWLPAERHSRQPSPEHRSVG
jgi:IclR family acetate operon transcriptional repressor